MAQHLYSGGSSKTEKTRAAGIIKADLDYVTEHWTDLGFDLWEEVKAHHFYTRLVQRKALLAGAQLADLLGDSSHAKKYKDAAQKLETVIATHWLPLGSPTPSKTQSTGLIWDSFDRERGIDYKRTGLDAAVVLAALHSHDDFDEPHDRFFSPSDDRILKTAWELAKAFQKEYLLAKSEVKNANLGVPIGRYPGDKYNGYDSSQAGNPWYLTTLAFAELYYRCAEEWLAQDFISVTPVNKEFLKTLTKKNLKEGEIISKKDPRFGELTSAIQELGDSYIRRVQYHEGPGPHFTEEYSRIDGSPQGAKDLSWSYASLLTAAQHRRLAR